MSRPSPPAVEGRRIGRLILTYLRSAGLGAATRARYRAVLFGFAETAGGLDRDASTLTTGDVCDWLEGRQVAAPTLSHELSVLRGFCRWLVLERLLEREPTLGVHVPRARKPRRRLPARVGAAALASTADPRTRLVVALALEGLRPREIAALLVEDLHGDVLVVGGERARRVALSRITQDETRRYLDGRHSGPLVRSQVAPFGHLTPGRIGDIVRRATRQAGVKRAGRDGVDLMGLRHSGARSLIERGADPATLAAILGHENLTEIDFQHRPWASRPSVR